MVIFCIINFVIIVIFIMTNTLIPQSDETAFLALSALHKHVSNCCDGTVVIGGDYNCTENPAINRLCMPTERRPKVAMTLKNIMHKLSLCDAWRRLNLNECKFTWQRSNPNCVSKSRLDRFYIPLYLISSIHTCKIIHCSLCDHSAVLLTVNFPVRAQRGSAYWHFKHSLLEDQNFKKFLDFCCWSNWQKQKCDFPDVATWWDLEKFT